MTFSKRDSALGKHSADFGGLEATADHQSSSAPKPPKNYESPTAIPRILEEESRAEQQSSLRADSGGEAIHKDKSQKVDSRGNALSPSLRDFALAKSWQSTSSKNAKAQKVDSRISKETSAIAERYPLFCDEKLGLFKDSQGRALGVRNRPEQPEIANLSRKAQSSSKKPTPEISPSDSKILDEKCGLQGKSQRSYLSGDLWDFSPLPHFSLKAESPQVDSRFFTQTTQPAHHDSKNCGGAVGALRFLGKVSELGVRAFHKNRNTAALPTQS